MSVVAITWSWPARNPPRTWKQILKKKSPKKSPQQTESSTNFFSETFLRVEFFSEKIFSTVFCQRTLKNYVSNFSHFSL